MKYMLFRSPTEGRLIRVAEKVETRNALSPPLKRGGNSFGRIYEMLYPLTMICPVYFSSSGGVWCVVGEEVRLVCIGDETGVDTPNTER